MKSALLQILHIVLGAAFAAGAAYLSGSHVDPILGAAIGSALSSAISANSTPPNQAGKNGETKTH
jgi:hypothetical protein